MVRQRVVLTILLGLLGGAVSLAAERNPVVVMETSLGKIKIELYPDKAPLTVKNFRAYVEGRFYDGTIFHRVAKAPALIQGGGFEPGMKEKKPGPPIKNEAGKFSNKAYTIAMARSTDSDSAAAQFYINARDNLLLDKARDPDGVGYCVFGKVLEGMDVVDKIWNVKTNPKEAPVQDVIVKSVRVEN